MRQREIYLTFFQKFYDNLKGNFWLFLALKTWLPHGYVTYAFSGNYVIFWITTLFIASDAARGGSGLIFKKNKFYQPYLNPANWTKRILQHHIPYGTLLKILFFYQQFVFISTWLIYCILCHVSHFIILMYTFLSGTLTIKFSACHSHDINWSHVRKLICSIWEIQTFALIEIFFELKMEIFKDNRNACLEARNIKRT